MITVLLSGFEPFAEHTRNPSWEAVERVAAEWDGTETLVTVQLPVEFGAAARMLLDAVEQLSPDLVVAVGLAAGRDAVTPERIAMNVRDGRIADNAGYLPVDEPVVAEGPTAHWSTLPIKAIVGALRQHGLPAAVSNTAGSFVCNDVFYALQNAFDGSGIRSGFIHVPATPETGGTDGLPTLPLDTIVEGLRLAVRTTLDTPTDARVAEGATH